MTRKLLLIGGIGNQLFILARALSVESKKVVVFKLSHRQKRMLKFCGWKFHRDWIDMDYLCDRLGVEVRQLKIESFFILLPWY